MDIRGPTWNTMLEILLEILRSGGGGGVRNFWRGVREKGGSSEPPENPPNPLWLRTCCHQHMHNGDIYIVYPPV